MLCDIEILEIIKSELFERVGEDEAFSDMNIDTDYNIEFTPPEHIDSIDLYSSVTMVISEWLGFGESGFAYSFELSSMRCIKDKESFTHEIKKAFDKYSKEYHDSIILHKMAVINHISDGDKNKIKNCINNNEPFTMRFISKKPYYELI